ncbi:MAG: hypothetical protein ACOC32_02415 [Nanoarchaeota archaeon]
MDFYSLMATLARTGVWDVVLPFMLVFTIVYATLTTMLGNMFGNDKKKFAVIIAMVIAFGVVIPHSIGAYPPGGDIVLIINTALPNIALIAVGIIGLFIILGMFGINFDILNTPLMTIIVLAAIGAVVYVFASAGGARWEIPRWLSFLNDPDTQALLIVGAVFFMIIRFITKEPKEEDRNKSGVEKFAEFLGDVGKLTKKRQ